MLGQTISHYTILEKLGEGGMGVVYKAHDTALDRDVALKFLPQYLTSDPVEKERFTHEARAAAALTHQNIAVVYEIGEHEGRLFIAMEYVQGQTLKKTLGSAEVPSIRKVLDIAIQICEGLAAAHEKGIVHRDIKSENIILTPKGQPKIMDFGLAKVKGAAKLTKTGSTLGTAAYMSPEQAQGEEVDHRSDIFSFGVVLYEMLTGHLPFRGEHQAALMYSIINEEPQPVARFNEKATPELEHIVAKALAKDREERYQHADDLLADLRRERKKLDYARTGYISTAPVPPVPPAPAVRPKSVVMKIGISVVVIVVLVILALVFNPFGLEITPKKAAASREKTIAVLPFTNLGGGQEEEFFCDGMTEDILTQLSKIADLSVISRNSSMRYKGSSKSLTEIGAELGAGTILQGNIRRSGDRVRIVAQLIDAASDRQVWGENYDREMKDIFDIQSDVARSIAAALSATLTRAEIVNIDRKPTENLDAYAYCVKGREYYYRYTKDAFKAGEALFLKAIALDTNYAAAYAGLADVYGTEAALFPPWSEERIDTAIILAQTAVARDPGCAEAYKALGLAYELKGRITKAIESSRKAIELNPNYGPAIANLGDELMASGKTVEGMKWRLLATKLDPLMAWRYMANGSWYVTLCDDENAGRQFKRALELQPDLASTYNNMLWWYLDQRQWADAKAANEKYFALTNDTTAYITNLFNIHLYTGNVREASLYFREMETRNPPTPSSRAGRAIGEGLLAMLEGNPNRAKRGLEEARRYVEQVYNDGHEGFWPPYALTGIHAILGNKSEARRWLKALLAKNILSPRSFDTDPLFANLRDDAEAKAMIHEYRGKIDDLRRQVRELGSL